MTVSAAASVVPERDERSKRDKILWSLLGVAILLVLAKAVGILPEPILKSNCFPSWLVTKSKSFVLVRCNKWVGTTISFWGRKNKRLVY